MSVNPVPLTLAVALLVAAWVAYCWEYHVIAYMARSRHNRQVLLVAVLLVSALAVAVLGRAVTL